MMIREEKSGYPQRLEKDEAMIVIKSIHEYLAFFDSIRKRTMTYVNATPESMLDWRPAPEKFTTRQLLLHLGSTQVMFLQAIRTKQWKYSGHGSEKGETLDQIAAYLQQCHATFTEGLHSLGDEILSAKIPTMHGHDSSAWRLLMGLAEHEIHHRGQLSAYLQVNSCQPPQIFGLKIENVATE